MTRDFLIIVLGTAFLAAMLARYVWAVRARNRAESETIFAEASTLLSNPRVVPGKTVGSYQLEGSYEGLPVRAETIVDTLNVRKLPSLWLMVTIADPLPLRATFDLMMRATGPSTFSKFDFLPFTIETPANFPQQAILRTDDLTNVLPAFVVLPHLQLFFGPRPKELLVSPKGVRMVLQLSEAQRARYGVFRQAEFGGVSISADELRLCLDLLTGLRQSILAWSKKPT